MTKTSITENSIVEETRQPFLYVALGASAGGLEAIESFFKNVPDSSGLAFFLIQHLSPDYKSIMPDLIAKWTKLNVYRVLNGMKVEPNSVYLIPPKKEMKIFHGHLYLDDYEKDSGIHLPIDTFFKSLAIDQGKNSIGIILSGTGSDGTLGLKAIKEKGGMVIVQDPTTAKFDGMPNNAIATGLVEFILEPKIMPETLIRYIKHPYSFRSDSGIISDPETSTYKKILNLLRSETGLDFAQYKSSTIYRRIERRIAIVRCQSIEDYYFELSRNQKEVHLLYKDLLIGVTGFFRDKPAWDILNQSVIPKIITREDKETPTRIWIAGCSTGEEAYSMAIALQEALEEAGLKADFKIFATDMDKSALEKAGTGFYSEGISQEVPTLLLNKYFKKVKDDGFQIRDEIRKKVVFAPHNLINDPPFSKIDLISCRNLLIYLMPEVQAKILNMFLYSITKNGFLFLGSSESLNHLAEKFEVVDSKWRIYQLKGVSLDQKLNDFNHLNLQATTYKFGKTTAMGAPTRKNSLIDKLLLKILNAQLFTGLLIDKNNNIVHLFGEVNQFLTLPQGQASWNLFDLLHKNLYTIVSSLVFKVNREKKNVQINNHKVSLDKDKDVLLSLQVKYLTLDDQEESYLLVVFQVTDNAPLALNKIQSVSFDAELRDRIANLERELGYREESLQTTIEELETSNEELQASNEELVSANEELQSTNEELQSVNEELHTVNAEHQKKIEELTILNNDIQNLLDNTTIGSLYLDSKLRIRRFTSGISKILNIMQVDHHRPISHISSRTNYTTLYEDALSVLETLKPVTREINDFDEWYRIRIKPYREVDNSIDGVIVILDQITELKMVNQELEFNRNLYRMITSNIPDTDFYLFDLDLKVLLAQGTNMQKWGYTISSFENKYLQECLDPVFFNQVEPVVKATINSTFEEREFRYNNEWLKNSGVPVYDQDNQLAGGLIISKSIHKIKHLENRCTQNLNWMAEILNAQNQPFLIIDDKYKIVTANQALSNLFERKSSELVGTNMLAEPWQINLPSGKKTDKNKLPIALSAEGKKTGTKYELKFHESQLLFEADLYPAYNLNQKVDFCLIILHPQN
jgi:two-component system CheB/CheR fusion protein